MVGNKHVTENYETTNQSPLFCINYDVITIIIVMITLMAMMVIVVVDIVVIDLRQEVYVFAGVYLFVCLSVCNITQKAMDKF